jgi:glycosyltransferase involved in cell wall biosynthesis
MPRTRRMTTHRSPLRVTFVMEQHVGLKTFTENLRRVIDRDPRVSPTWAFVTYFDPDGVLERYCGFLPRQVRGRLRGALQVWRALRTPADARFYLTQVPVALGGPRARALPYLTMTDVTPVQYDAMADGYGHAPDRIPLVRWLKHRINLRVFQDASRVLSLSEWTAASIRADYRVPEERAEVLAPGIDVALWHRTASAPSGPCRILFVGADFPRKGGFDLLEAFRALPAGLAELHIATSYDLQPEPGVVIHRGLTANSPELIALFHASHLFVLPSRAESFGQVIVEALAAGLPCVVADVGAMPGIIVPGESGLVVPAADVPALTSAVRRLIDDAELRSRMARAARQRAEAIYDANVNATRVVDLLLDAARAGDGARQRP